MNRWLPDPLPDLEAALAALVTQVPPGRVTTYGALAAALGYSPAARWAAGAVRGLPNAETLPLHRIVRATGELPGLAAETPAAEDVSRQRALLTREGVPFRAESDRVELESALWNEFKTDSPIQKLVDMQNELAVLPEPSLLKGTPKLVGAVDVWYPQDAIATGAFAMCEWPDPRVVYETATQAPQRFPYITGLLTYRELPALTAVLKQALERATPDVVLVDGSGKLHPRRAGIAVHLAAATGLRTIGVTKTRLIGSIDDEDLKPGESSPVRVNGEILGAAVRPASRSKKLLYVSPGRGVDVETAVKIVLPLLTSQKRLPGPIDAADRLSRTFKPAL